MLLKKSFGRSVAVSLKQRINNLGAYFMSENGICRSFSTASISFWHTNSMTLIQLHGFQLRMSALEPRMRVLQFYSSRAFGASQAEDKSQETH